MSADYYSDSVTDPLFLLILMAIEGFYCQSCNCRLICISVIIFVSKTLFAGDKRGKIYTIVIALLFILAVEVEDYRIITILVAVFVS